MDVQGFVDLVGRERACGILRTDDADAGAKALDAAVAAGFRVLEVTLTTPRAFELLRDLAKTPGVVAGAGTVLTVADAETAVAHGASFVVSPVCDPAVIARATELGVASLPGCHTPTEMLAAHRAGAPLIKLFPAPAGGPAYLRSVLAPLPFLKIVPTNGVDEHNVGDWLAAGAYGVGFAAALFAPDDVRARRFDVIEQRARRILDRVRPATVATA